MKLHTKTLLTSLAAFAVAAGAHAATIVSYDFQTNADPTTEAANTSSNTVDGFGFSGDGRSSSSFSYFGRGPSTDPLTTYISFTITADSGYQLDLDQLDFDYHFQQSQGVTTDKVAFEVRSSVDGFASAIPGTYEENPADQSTPLQAASLALTGGSYDGLTSVEFRLYATNDTESIFNDIVRWDNIVVTGDAPLVPEPGSLALMGLGGLCVMRRRRK